jgi:apolipoprotein N-acyltransferase
LDLSSASKNIMIRKILLAFAGGIILSLAFPQVDWGVMAWIALMPLMIAVWTIKGPKRKRNGFLLGYLFGFTFFAINLFWLSSVSWLGVVVLAGYLALYPALWAMCSAVWLNPWLQPEVGGLWRQSFRALSYAFGNAALWAFSEWLRGWMLTGFGWNGLGVAMHDQAVMAQCADVFGVAGLSGLMLMVQAVLVQLGRRMHGEAQLEKKLAHTHIGIKAMLVTAAFLYGVRQLSICGNKECFGINVLLVQLNVPQEAARQTWTAEEIHQAYEEEVAKAMTNVEANNQLSLEKSAAQEKEMPLIYPDWLVLPEVALTGRLMTTANNEHGMWMENEISIEAFRQAGNFDILLGMAELEAVSNGSNLTIAEDPKAWNSLVVLPQGSPLLSYRKKHLVMFGEYIPLVDELPWLKKIYEQQAGATFDGAFSAGTATAPLPMTVRNEKLSIIPSICFEDTVPRETRSFLRQEPQVIVNVTNDGWFKQTAAAAQHFANAKFRAIELRRPMIRCSNTGVTGVVSISGHSTILLDEKGSHFMRGSGLFEVKVPRQPAISLYQIWGDIPVIMAGLLAWVVFFVRYRITTRKN